MKHNIHVLLNKDFKGDDNQAKAVGGALKEIFEKTGAKVDLFEGSEDALRIAEEADTKHYVITAGEHGLAKVAELKAAGVEAVTITTAHMHFPLMPDLPKAQMPDILSVPQGVLTEEQRAVLNPKTRLVEPFGVPHGINAESLLEATKDIALFNGEPFCQNVVGIMLAGDAPNGADMLFFTPEEAKEKAKLIYQATKDHYQKLDKSFDETTLFFVTNGPRTGKHDYDAKSLLEPNPHMLEDTIDTVSFAFTDQLRQLMEADGLQATQLRFEDFKFRQPSAYGPMLRLLIETKGLYFVPAESTSMVTEASYPASQGVTVIAYHPGSENPSHTAHLEQCYEMGLLSILESEGLKVRKAVEPADVKEATDVIVNAVLAENAIHYLPLQSALMTNRNTEKTLGRRVRFDDGFMSLDEAESDDDDEEKTIRRNKMTKEKHPNALTNGATAEPESGNTAQGRLQQVYDRLPKMPESVTKHMTWQNAGYAAAGTLALVGLFAAGRAGYIPNPLSSTPAPRGPSR